MVQYRSSTTQQKEKQRRRRKAIAMRILVGIVLAGMLAGLFFGIRAAYRGIRGWVDSVMNDPLLDLSTADASHSGETPAYTAAPDPAEKYVAELSKAERLAASYDYDGAIASLKAVPDYPRTAYLQNAVQDLMREKTLLKKADITQVCQFFVHSLIVDPERAFASADKNSLNQSMLTAEEFAAVLEQLYENDYVLVRIHDLAAMNGEGKFVQGTVMLPEGKKPLVISAVDIQYYEDMTGKGFASRLVLDEEGLPKCEYRDIGGNLSVGDYDVIPMLESFVREHPDFSYKGARGCIALTAYEGILGYRTASKYGNPYDPEYKPAYASIDPEKEQAEAAKVCARLKELGWEFASYTWGRINMQNADAGRVKTDMVRWMEEVNPLLGGGTDILIFPFGLDFGSWRSYSSDDEKFTFLRTLGFRYYCPVDAYNIPWVQFNAGAGYLRLGGVNLDGHSLYYRAEKLKDFFDAQEILDKKRPLPVPSY